LNYWNFPEDATDEDKHKFALRSISRQIKHKKSFLTYFTHSRNYISRIQNFQKLNKKETQEALKWAVSKNLPFPDKAIEYDIKQVSSDSVDEKSFLTLIAPHNLVAQQEKYFQDVGMNIRQITTVPYLASKAFRLNYPDYFKETAIIFYMGESYSNLIFIKNHEFHYEREFSIGRKDLLEALNQEVNTLNGPRKLSPSDALLLLDTYGFQHKTGRTIKSLGIDYSRYSIMIRPIAERIIMEISRSIDYYRKTFSLLADGDVFLVGTGAVIPGIARFIEDQLGRRTSVLNPMRADIFAYKSKESEIPEKLLPCYTLHLAAAYPDKDLNVITKATRNREIFIAGTKLTHLILAVFLIFAGIRTYDMLGKRDQVEADYRRTRTRWQNISDVSTTFMSMSEKEQTLTQILNQIRMDQYSTDRALTFLKMISNLTPAGIHLIDFQLNKPVDDSNKDKSDFILKGYITRNPSVADIYLNNYLAKFRDTGFFESIELSTDDERTETGTRRSFTIKGVLKKL
jgi:Tfp pilus assembly PilM family ATPase